VAATLYSPPKRGCASLKKPTWYEPAAGAMKVFVSNENEGAAETWFDMLIHVGSRPAPASKGLVPVIQFSIFGSPVLVVVRLGWSNETPVSTMPIVTPRPSHVGCAFTNCAAFVSCVGM
jgi:hypothetical protein